MSEKLKEHDGTIFIQGHNCQNKIEIVIKIQK